MTDLSNILRPKSLEEFIAQKHLVSPSSALYKLIQKKEIPHMFFWGTPGSGKTTLARIISTEMNTSFYELNATSLKVDDLRKIFTRYENSLIKPILFIDEVHRLSKNQQEVLLPVMEKYQVIIIGASTENPFYSLTSAIRSRSLLFEFKSHSYEDLEVVISRAQKEVSFLLEDDAKEYLILSSAGDARALLNLLNFAVKLENNITLKLLKELRDTPLNDGCSSSTSHYDLTSAMIKSIRGSDIDASLYYLARLIKGAENPEFIVRRLSILASEDIGLANHNALILASSTHTLVSKLGYPESRILLAQLTIYLCCSPKSNSSYLAINNALSYVETNEQLEIPNPLKQDGKDYKYPHDFGGYVKQKYLETEVKFFEFVPVAYEKQLRDWLEKLKTSL